MVKNNKLLEIRNLNKIFIASNRRIHAVNDVSFDLKNGETVGLIGESGSGKTTIGRTIIRLNNANSGQVLLKGKNITRRKIDKKNEKLLRNNIQMIFQDPYSSLNEQMNIETIVSEPIKTLKLSNNYLQEFLDGYYDVIKFYKYELIEKGYKYIRQNELNNLNFIKNEYAKFINKLSTFEITSGSKWGEAEALISYYYNLKIEGNSTVTNNNLNLIKKLLDLLKKTKTKYRKGILKTDLEKKLFEINKAINKIEPLTKHTQIYWNKKDKLRILKKFNYEAKDYANYEKVNLKSTIINMIESLLSESKNFAIMARNSKTVSEYNMFEIESKIKLIISQLLKRDIDILHFNNISNSISKLEKNIFSVILKNINKLNQEIKVNIQDESIILKINKNKFNSFDLSPLWKEIVIFNKKTINYFYNNFSIHELKFSQQEIKIIKAIKNKDEKSINKKIIKLEQEIKIHYSKVPNKKYMSKLAQLNIEKLKLEKDYKDLFKEWILKFNKAEDKKKDDFNIEIKNLKSEISKLKDDAKQLFISKKELILNSKLPYFDKKNNRDPKKELNKRFNIKIKKSSEINNKLEKESERLKKDIKMIFDITTGKSFNKNKLKKYLVREKVFDALEDAGLTKAHAFRYPHEFSGGMRQRVGIARAIISNPDIIIADEPISALDLSIQAQIANLLKKMQIKKKMSMIFIAHDLAMVKHISDRILIIHLGRIVESGKTEEIFSNPIHPYTKNLIESMPDISSISKGFVNNNFSSDYLKNYSLLQQPKYHLIRGSHKVLATEAQLKVWKK